MSTSVTLRKMGKNPEGNSSNETLQRQRDIKHRQSKFKLYSETMRKETRAIKKALFLRLLVLPLAAMALVSIYFVALNHHKDGMAVYENLSSTNTDPSAERLSKDRRSSPQALRSGSTTQQQHDSDLPKWITDYAQWHQQMRAQFPGDELFENPKAPKLLVRTCLGICGGLHDRLGQLPWDIYLAMRLKRVLLIAWQRPRSLENFLLPPLDDKNTLVLDWRIPESQKFGFDDIRRVRSEVLELFDDNGDRNPGEGDFWAVGFDKAMVRAGAPNSPGADIPVKKESKYFDAKILRHRLLGHLDENILEERLEKEGYYKNEAKWKAADLHKGPSFGAIWDLFFRPSPAVRTEIVQAMGEMGLLVDGTKVDKLAKQGDDPLPSVVPFTAVHCRVRHPKAHPQGAVMKGKNEKYPADKTGLPWVEGGPQRAFALETANKALVCALDIRQGSESRPPVYFLSDSNDLVTHVSVELTDSTYLKDHGSNSSWVNPQLLETVRSQTIVTRNTTIENAHIDRQKGRKPFEYYATFVDLYLAMKARCVVYGIGYYAAFAAKISGTDCTYLYAKESWGAQVEKSAKICPNHEESSNK